MDEQKSDLNDREPEAAEAPFHIKRILSEGDDTLVKLRAAQCVTNLIPAHVPILISAGDFEAMIALQRKHTEDLLGHHLARILEYVQPQHPDIAQRLNLQVAELRALVEATVTKIERTRLNTLERRTLVMELQLAEEYRTFLKKNFGEEKRVLFVETDTLPSKVATTYKFATQLQQDLGITHLAVPIPPRHEQKFHALLAEGRYPELLVILQKIMISQGEEPDDATAISQVFLNVYRKLSKSFQLHCIGTEAHVSRGSENAFDVYINELAKLVRKNPHARIAAIDVLSFVEYNAGIQLSNQDVRNNLNGYNFSLPLALRRELESDQVVTIARTTQEQWDAPFSESDNNLYKVLEEYPHMRTNIGVNPQKTQLKNQHIDSFSERTFGMYDGVIITDEWHEDDNDDDSKTSDKPKSPTKRRAPKKLVPA